LVTSTATTRLRGAWGRYSQSQSLFSIQAEDGETALARAERSEQRVLGVWDPVQDEGEGFFAVRRRWGNQQQRD